MKKAMIDGIVTGVGVSMAVMAATKHPTLDWTEVALMLGITLAVVGIVRVCEAIKDFS